METNKAQKMEASKQFSVPVERLFQAWNDPAQLKQWWKPMGNHLMEVTNDLKVDGTVRYVFNDNTLIISGEYEDVKENEKLTYTWNWNFPADAVKNASYKLNILFSKKDQGSEIRVTQEQIQDEETLHPNEEGWDKGLTDLENFLNSQQHESAQEKSGAASEEPGYQESPEQIKVGGG